MRLCVRAASGGADLLRRAGMMAARRRATVVLLHGSASNGGSWRRVIGELPQRCRAVAPDLLGNGAANAWPPGAPHALEVQRQAILKLLPSADDYDLVGYSYGGAVALHLAIAEPHRVRSLTLIEPVFFAALRYAGDHDAYDRFRRVRADFVGSCAAGEPEPAMQRFIDFWSGAGAWSALPETRRAELVRLADQIVIEWPASFAADPGRTALAELGARTLLMRGDRSPQPMRRLVDALHALMPGSRRSVVEGANHLLPLTHAAALSDAIAAQIDRTGS